MNRGEQYSLAINTYNEAVFKLILENNTAWHINTYNEVGLTA